MAELELADPPPFAVVFVAFNTFFNLGTPAAQRRCLERVAALLAPEGLFVLEAFVPVESHNAPTGASVAPRRITADEVVLSVSQHDADEQTVTGQHIHVTEAGIRLRPWHLRYAVSGRARCHGRGRRPPARVASRRLGRSPVHGGRQRPRVRLRPR